MGYRLLTILFNSVLEIILKERCDFEELASMQRIRRLRDTCSRNRGKINDLVRKLKDIRIYGLKVKKRKRKLSI